MKITSIHTHYIRIPFDMGAPKQELWVHAHAARLEAKVALCVGATIDFLSGEKQRAPRWMRLRSRRPTDGALSRQFAESLTLAPFDQPVASPRTGFAHRVRRASPARRR